VNCEATMEVVLIYEHVRLLGLTVCLFCFLCGCDWYDEVEPMDDSNKKCLHCGTK